jgi:integrase
MTDISGTQVSRIFHLIDHFDANQDTTIPCSLRPWISVAPNVPIARPVLQRRILPIGLNPARGIEKYPERGRERFLSFKELTRLGEAIREGETVGLPYTVDETTHMAKHAAKMENRRTVIGPHAAAAMRLLIFTGARLREILHLKWEHVDFERGMLLLADSKTGKKAIVLNAPALAVLTNLPRVGGYVIAGQAAGTDKEQPRSDLKRPWHAVAKRAGLEGVRIHDLRHTHASIGAGAGLGLPIIGKLLGHAHATTTARYAHLDADPLRRRPFSSLRRVYVFGTHRPAKTDFHSMALAKG